MHLNIHILSWNKIIYSNLSAFTLYILHSSDYCKFALMFFQLCSSEICWIVLLVGEEEHMYFQIIHIWTYFWGDSKKTNKKLVVISVLQPGNTLFLKYHPRTWLVFHKQSWLTSWIQNATATIEKLHITAATFPALKCDIHVVAHTWFCYHMSLCEMLSMWTFRISV